MKIKDEKKLPKKEKSATTAVFLIASFLQRNRDRILQATAIVILLIVMVFCLCENPLKSLFTPDKDKKRLNRRQKLEGLINATLDQLKELEKGKYKGTTRSEDGTWHQLPPSRISEAFPYQHTLITGFQDGKIIIRGKDGVRETIQDPKTKGDSWITPHKYGSWNYKEFGKSHKPPTEDVVGHKHLGGKGEGITLYPIRELLRKADEDLDYVLISQGMACALDTADDLEDKLLRLEVDNKKIKEGFLILESEKVPYVLLSLVLKRKKVGVLYHSTC